MTRTLATAALILSAVVSIPARQKDTIVPETRRLGARCPAHCNHDISD